MKALTPYHEINSLQTELENLFNDFFGLSERQKRFSYRRNEPALDLLENDDELLVIVDLPGFDEKDIKLTLVDNGLSISAKREYDKKTDNDKVYRRERFSGSYQRSIKFNTKINRDQISAVYKNGVLKVKCPKAEDEKPKKIEVKVS
ncbi:Hsp20/alpha crystallin family protein [bacterium]|nr:Hsp20/alpha crystallin family protein [bacterium]